MRARKFAVLLGVVLAGCDKRQAAQDSGIDLAGMDTSVAPGDDFNLYTNGGWMKATPIPADKSSYGVDAILTDETRKRTLSLIEEAAKSGAPAGTFYASFTLRTVKGRAAMPPRTPRSSLGRL